MPPLSHPRLPSADRKAQLLDVAMDLFAKKGFAGTTTREIAAAAGVTEAIIFRHFATKQDLYRAIVDSRGASKEMQAWFAETHRFMAENNDEGVFRNLILAIIGTRRDNPRFERLMQWAALESPEFQDVNKQSVMPFVADLTAYIVRRQSEGALRTGNPLAMLMALVGIAENYANHKYLCASPDRPAPEPSMTVQLSDEDAAETFLGIFLNGIRIEEKNPKNI